MRYTVELRFGRLGKTAELKFGRLLNMITQTQTEVIFIHVHLFTLNFLHLIRPLRLICSYHFEFFSRYLINRRSTTVLSVLSV